jgi:hypothetical protein
MKHTLAAIILAAGLAACASSVPAVPAKAAPTAEEYKVLWDAAYWVKPPSASEEAFTQLIARDDLTTDQRAEAYLGRGLMRGIFVRDHALAFPQCAVLDFAMMEQLSPEHARLKQMQEGRAYQFSRFQYFNDAPQDCISGAETYRQKLGL